MARLRCVLLAALLLAGCASSGASTDLYRSLHPEEQVKTEDRFLGHLRDALAQHARDCGEGLSFTARVISESTRRDWERMVRTFE
jgi:hypothetical protein